RVHRDAAHGRAHAPPALRAGLAELAQAVLVVADLADRRAAAHVHLPHLAGAEPQRHVRPFTGDDLHRRAGASRELRTLAGLELDAMHLRADRNALQRHRIAGPDRRVAARLDR